MSGPAPGALELNARATLARAYVRVVGSIREPAWIVSDAVLPALGMCAFVLLYRGLGAPKSYDEASAKDAWARAVAFIREQAPLAR